MGIWAVETYIKDTRISSGHRLYRANRQTIEEVLAIEQKYLSGSRLREVSEEEWARCNAEGFPCVHLDPECRDWLLRTGFEDQHWDMVCRNTTLSDIVKAARDKADGICFVFFRPANPEEIATDDAERQEWTQGQLRASRIGGIIGLWVQIVITVGLAFAAVDVAGQHESLAFGLLILAGLSGLNLLWAAIKWALYEVSFTIGKGLRDGKG